MRRLPLHPQPLPDEALSSWLWRLSQAYGLTPDVFTRAALDLPISDSHLGALDADPPPELLARLADRTGVSLERVRVTTLAGYGELLFGAGPSPSIPAQARLKDYVLAFPNLAPAWPREAADIYGLDQGWRPWVCKDLLGFSPQACRGCLAEGAVPYVRIHWRPAWMLSCPLHGELLEPIPLLPHVLEASQAGASARRAPRQVLALDRMTYEAVTRGSVEAPSGERVSAAVCLRALRALIDEMLRPSGQLKGRAYASVRHLWRMIDLEFHAGMGAKSIYESLTVERRELSMTVTALAFEHLATNPVEPVSGMTRSIFQPPPTPEPFPPPAEPPPEAWKPVGLDRRLAAARRDLAEAYDLRWILRYKATKAEKLQWDFYLAVNGVPIVTSPPWAGEEVEAA